MPSDIQTIVAFLRQRARDERLYAVSARRLDEESIAVNHEYAGIALQAAAAEIERLGIVEMKRVVDIGKV